MSLPTKTLDKQKILELVQGDAQAAFTAADRPRTELFAQSIHLLSSNIASLFRVNGNQVAAITQQFSYTGSGQLLSTQSDHLQEAEAEAEAVGSLGMRF